MADKLPKRQRSAITNGTLLPDTDGRSAWARRFKDLLSSHVSDLGGDDNISEAKRSLARRAAILECELERLESGFALAGMATPESIDLYARVSGTLARLLERVGIKRRPKDVTPSLASYVAAKAAQKAKAPPVPNAPKVIEAAPVAPPVVPMPPPLPPAPLMPPVTTNLDTVKAAK
jgi:hypothetical protein